jgi:hypothetical protein
MSLSSQRSFEASDSSSSSDTDTSFNPFASIFTRPPAVPLLPLLARAVRQVPPPPAHAPSPSSKVKPPKYAVGSVYYARANHARLQREAEQLLTSKGKPVDNFGVAVQIRHLAASEYKALTGEEKARWDAEATKYNQANGLVKPERKRSAARVEEHPLPPPPPRASSSSSSAPVVVEPPAKRACMGVFETLELKMDMLMSKVALMEGLLLNMQ